MNKYEEVFKRFEFELKGRGYSNFSASTWVVVKDREANTYLRMESSPKAYQTFSTVDEALEYCIDYLKKEKKNKYNSLEFKLIENEEKINMYINFNNPKSKEEIDEVINAYKNSKANLLDFTRMLDGELVEKSTLLKDNIRRILIKIV